MGAAHGPSARLAAARPQVSDHFRHSLIADKFPDMRVIDMSRFGGFRLGEAAAAKGLAGIPRNRPGVDLSCAWQVKDDYFTTY